MPALDLRAHVLHLQRLDRVPIELQLLGNVTDRGLPAAATNIECKAFCEVRVVRQQVLPLALHSAANAARHTPYLELQNDAIPGTWKIANSAHPLVVPARLLLPAEVADRFFERRASVTIRTSRSPNTPWTVARARKPLQQPLLPFAHLNHISSYWTLPRLQAQERQHLCMLPPL